MKRDPIKFLLLRYIIAIAISFPNLFIFYFVFTPLTTYASFLLLNLFYTASFQGSIIYLQNTQISLISACIAGSAYYLLLALNLITPMEKKTRIKSIIFLLVGFFVFNVLRIFLFSVLANNNFQYFDVSHKYVWYFGSTLLVIIIWFANALIYNIKAIPAYSDIKYLIKQIRK